MIEKLSAGESPDIVYGRLLEACHIGGYTLERVVSEFKWMLTDDRWKSAAGGFDDVDVFLESFNLKKYRVPLADQDEIAHLVQAARGTLRATGRALGTSHTTIRRRLGTNVPNGMKSDDGDQPSTKTSGTNVPEWFRASHEEIAKPAQLRVQHAEKEQAREQRREANRAKVAETSDLNSLAGLFATIVIDPPWDFTDEGDVDPFGRGRPTYVQMPIDDLLAFPVGAKADVDCHLYLWITNRSLPKGFALIERWGFRYVTCLTWCKPSIGMGNYFRGSSEQVLFAVKGSQPLKRKDVGTWFAAPRGAEQSSKPDAFYALVESCSPGPYLNIFGRPGREARPLWTEWGADACTTTTSMNNAG